jgi:tetratricopeptide (TPR) repeat protein
MKQQPPLFGLAPRQDDATRRALAEAIQLHAAGRFEDALKVVTARGLLKTPTGNSIAGDIHLRRGDAREALKAFDTAVRLAPTAPEPYANRGAALLELGRLEDALAALDRALRLRSEYATAHFNRGNVLRAMGRYEDAATAYTRALRAQPNFAEAHLNRGLALGALKRWQEALDEFSRALRIKPTLGGAQIGRAMAYRDMGQFPDAFAAIDSALATDPQNVEGMHFRASLLNDAQRHEEALAAADALLLRDASDVEALMERARALQKLRRFHQGLATTDALIALAPGKAEVHVTRGAILAELGRQEESLAAIAEAKRLGASERTYLSVLALSRALLGDTEAALADFARAIAADPHDFQTYYNRAYLRISLGDWENGWEDHEWRLKQHDHPHRAFIKLAPKWTGEPVAGKRLLVYSEQGLGDTLQFVRYVPRLQATGAAVTLSVQPALTRLLKPNFPGVDVTDSVGLRAGFDYQVSLMSLPWAFHDTIETLPRATSYLSADPLRIAKWRGRISEGGLRVGIVWQGAKKYARDATRSIPLAKFAPLADVPGVQLFSVQAQVGLEQLDALGASLRITRFGEELENNPDGMQEMAAIMANLDVLVMSDTAPTHLAGALGRPTWVALSRPADWRWMEGRDDSPWYPTMRLFRQQTPGDWDGVFARIAAELAVEVARRG